MSQQDRFPIILGGVTAVVAAGLIYWGVSATSKYGKAKEQYDTTAAEVTSMEGGKLYPNEEHQRAKTKALAEYRTEVEGLQKGFDAYRPGDLPLVEPSEFTTNLKNAKEAAVKALTDAGTTLPPEFYLGFESYTNAPVRKEATGILGYELEAISELFKELADAKPVKLLNVFRPSVEEEGNKTFDSKDKNFRALPVEISFNGTEASFRHFLSALDDSKKFYYVIRSIRVSNEAQKAPTAADANFGKADAAPESGGAAAGGGDFSGGGFVLPGDEPAAPAAGTPATPAAAPGADEKILQQLLGLEKINVFLRIDIIQFLPSRELK